MRYQIHLKGHLDARWREWFGGFEIDHLEGGTTVLTGEVSDQSALHGQLARVRDLGLTIISIQAIPEPSSVL